VFLGAWFVLIQLSEWHKKTYDLTSNLYGSLYYTITGFHLLHVIIGLVILLTLLFWIVLGHFDDKNYMSVAIGGLYWHFVDVVWLFVFTTLFLVPYIS
jgi:cytochrome c oxidase subunit III